MNPTEPPIDSPTDADADADADDAVIAAVRAHYDAAGANVTALPDAADVRRRLHRANRRRRLRAAMLPAAAAAVVAVVLVNPDDASQRVAVQTRTSAASAEQTAQDEARRLDGDPPGFIVALHRTTPDNLRFRTLILDIAKDPRAYQQKRVPKECIRSERADIVAQLPGGGFGGSSFNLPRTRPGDVAIALLDLWRASADGFPRLPSGAVDPRTQVEPLPNATPTPADLSSAGAAVLVHAEGLRSLRVTFDNGATDQTDAERGYAIVGTFAPRSLNVMDPPVTLRSATLTFDGGRTLDLGAVTAGGVVYDRNGQTVEPIDTAAAAAGRCVPAPPALPPAGPGPDDEAAARAEVTATVENAAKGALPIDERVTAFVDPEWARQLVAELGEANIAGVADSTARMKDLVFTSPTTAIVQYDLQVPSVVNGISIPASMVTDVFGKVVLQDGRWVITSESICKLVGSVAPTSCAGMTTTEYPSEVYDWRPESEPPVGG